MKSKFYARFSFLALCIVSTNVNAQLYKLKADVNITAVNLENFAPAELNKWQRVDDNSLLPPTAADFTNQNVFFVIDHQLIMPDIAVTSNGTMTAWSCTGSI